MISVTEGHMIAAVCLQGQVWAQHPQDCSVVGVCSSSAEICLATYMLSSQDQNGNGGCSQGLVL